MVYKRIILGAMILTTYLVSCKNSNQKISETVNQDTLKNSKAKEMKSYLSMFEIPATNISRAINFYQALFDIKIEKMDMEGMQMGIFPYEGQMVQCVIIQAEGYQPSATGVTVYLNAGDNLQIILDKVENNGGQIIIPKTPHADESGYFAVFLDSEGNRMALNSPN